MKLEHPVNPQMNRETKHHEGRWYQTAKSSSLGVIENKAHLIRIYKFEETI